MRVYLFTLLLLTYCSSSSKRAPTAPNFPEGSPAVVESVSEPENACVLRAIFKGKKYAVCTNKSIPADCLSALHAVSQDQPKAKFTMKWFPNKSCAQAGFENLCGEVWQNEPCAEN